MQLPGNGYICKDWQTSSHVILNFNATDFFCMQEGYPLSKAEFLQTPKH